MLCDTCRWTAQPGFVRRPAISSAAVGNSDERGSGDFIPCPDCGGQAIAHCCEGHCEQPDSSNG